MQKILVGTENRDRLFGSAFNDTISGRSGDDQIFGGSGEDRISGGSGNNTLYGQAGADTFKIDQRTNDSMWTTVADFEKGVDKIDISGWGISSIDQLKRLFEASGADTTFRAVYGGADQLVQINNVLPGTLAATDFIFYTGGARMQTGTENDDVLFGGKGSDTLKGGGGDNELYGGAGDDVLSGGTLYGEAGADTFKLDQRTATYGTVATFIADFQKGVDRIDVAAWGISSLAQIKLVLQTKGANASFSSVYGGADYFIQIDKITVSKLTAADFVFYSGGARTQNGTTHSDWLFAGAGGDTLNGAGGEDRLIGGDGNDKLTGGEGYDTLYGRGGSDTFRLVQKSSAHDTIMDFQVGIDKIDISTSGVTSFDQLKFLLQAEYDWTIFRIYNRGYDQEVRMMNVALDKLTAVDFIFDKQDLKTQTAKETGSTLFGGKSANILLGGSGNDSLFGGAGNDILSGGLGQDMLYGQAGADIFRVATRVAVTPSFNFTTIGDFQVGIDKLDVSGFGITSFDQLKLVMTTTSTSIYIRSRFNSDYEVFLSGVAPAKLKIGDFIFATQEARNLSGTAGNDSLFGGMAADRLSGGNGDDELFGGAGSDTLIGGTGFNDLYGQAGADIFKVSKVVAENDVEDLVHDFQIGLDKVDLAALGISSFDQLQAVMYTKDGTSVSFYAYRSDGNFMMKLKNIAASQLQASDFIFDKQTSKTETGANTSDILFGTTGADTLNGAGGGDWLLGGRGNDRLFGGDGRDTLTGGTGADWLIGGVGGDVFQFRLLSDSGLSSSNRDTILDFSTAESDRINLS